MHRVIKATSLLLLLLPQLALADLIVIVKKDHFVSELSKEQLRRIYLGKIEEFPNSKTPVQPLDLEKKDESSNRFYQHVAKKSIRQLNAYWAKYLFNGKKRKHKHIADDRGIIDLVQSSEKYIGYINADSLNDDDIENVKIIYRCCGE